MFLQGTDANMATARKQKVKQTIPGLKAATEEGGGGNHTHTSAEAESQFCRSPLMSG